MTFTSHSRTRRAFTRSALLGGALVLSGAGGAQVARAASGLFVPVLPAPTGPHRVGVRTLRLVDRSRRDPWDPKLGAREVLVSVLYPALAGTARAPQFTPAAAAVYGELAPLLHPGLPESGVDWAGTLTHAHLAAPRLPRRLPLVLYSPGGGDPRGLGSGIAEELASHGRVVVTVDHPGDAAVVEFPDGRVRTTVFRDDPLRDPDIWHTMIATRVADLRFVLDRMVTALDPYSVSVYGHSAGGTAAVRLRCEDRRVGAALNLEGYLSYPDDESEWRDMTGHWVYTDFAAMAPQFEAAGLMAREARVRLVGEPVRQVRSCVREWLTKADQASGLTVR